MFWSNFIETINGATDDQLLENNAYKLMRGKIRKIAKEQGWSERWANAHMYGAIVAERERREERQRREERKAAERKAAKSAQACDFDPFAFVFAELQKG